MHIPENYLSPETCTVMAAATLPALAISIKKVKKELPKEKISLLGIGAAISFLSMMFNIPIPGGTTGHAVCGTLIACLLGPYAACISVTVALLIQAVLFGDGGIIALGANCFNMAFVLPFVGYAVFSFIKSKAKTKKGEYIGAGIGSYIGINAAALCAAIEFGIQPMLFKNSAGEALYCPYGLSVSIPAMMIGHLTIFGLAEIIFTVAIYSFVTKTSPNILYKSNDKPKQKPLIALLGVLICATPLGLLATGTAWGEWGSDEISQVVSKGTALGYTPSGLANGWSLETLCPDYTIGALPEWVAYIMSAIIGVGISVIVFKLISSLMKAKVVYDK